MISDQWVLAVDDEPANQRAVRRTLASEWRVLTAGSGREALELMAREPVALVIADQRMPGMSGAEFLAETVERHPDVIRVVLTGYTDVETLIDAINRGHVYHYLGKPWDPRELRQVVRRGLERHAAAAERRRLLGALQAAAARAQCEAERKGRLLALAAHELGTPLHILLNALALVREAPREAAALWLERALRAVEWLARSVAQLQDAGRLRSRPLPVRRERVCLGPLIARTVRAVCAAAAERRLALTAEPRDDALAIDADPAWLERALTELLSNAVRCTPDGGAVTVSTTADGDAVQITVADAGIGIAPEHVADLFEPFSAAMGDPLLHGSGRWAFGARGLGLGLSLVKAIADAHGGQVLVETALGAGSRFTLRLPHAADVAPHGVVGRDAGRLG